MAERKKKIILFPVCRPKPYNLLSGGSFPKFPESLKCNEILDFLLKHLICAKFQNCFQLDNETIQDFSAR